jgi:RNase P subunit RPR2
MAWDKIKNSAKELAEKGLEAAKEKKEQKQIEKQELKERIAEMDREGTAYCPKCYSTNLSANKRGWKMTTGFIGSNKVIVTCLKCGNKFKPGK